MNNSTNNADGLSSNNNTYRSTSVQAQGAGSSQLRKQFHQSMLQNHLSNEVSQQNTAILGTAKRSGINLSRIINHAASVREQQDSRKSQSVKSATFSQHSAATKMHPKRYSNSIKQNYTAIHDFAQDQLTHISRKEFVEDKLRDSEFEISHAKKQKSALETLKFERGKSRGGGINISESVLSYVSTKSGGAGQSSASKYFTTQAPSSYDFNNGNNAREQKNQTEKIYGGGLASKKLKMEAPKAANCQCSEMDCHRPTFKHSQCKHHFAQRVKKAFRYNLKHMYRGPEQAFNSLDFSGKGYILDSDIYACHVMKRINFSQQDIEDCFRLLNLFNNVSRVSALKDGVPPNGMSFDKFREIFFPQLHILDEENQSDEDRHVKELGRENSNSNHNQSKFLAERIRKLDLQVQTKISDNYKTLRKAFLSFDKDFDGFVTIEDFLHYFATEPIEFDDLQKLLKNKDRNGKGRIDFTDFSKWFGSAIHKSEGFYFRHDSTKVNPAFEFNLQRFNQKYPEKDLDQCRQDYNENLIEKVIFKIYGQWKTMRRAFMEMDKSKTGAITPEDLRFYLTHWGVSLNEEKLMELLNFFDADGDGKISYEDFQATVGKDLQPDQGRYWRQDMARPTRIKSCKSDHCWHTAQDFSPYCKIHLKMIQSKAFLLMSDMKQRLGPSQWNSFMSMLRSKADPDDPEQLFIDDFTAILGHFKIKLKQVQLDYLADSFPGMKEGTRPRIRVGRFYDISIALEQSQTYKSLKVRPISDGVEDKNGYTGQRHARKPLVDCQLLTESELVAIFLEKNKMQDLMRMCREINPDMNGVVTVVEIDDILRILYPNELEGKDLSELYEPFCSSQNKILIDYKGFRDMMRTKMKDTEITNAAAAAVSAQQTQKKVTPSKGGASHLIDLISQPDFDLFDENRTEARSNSRLRQSTSVKNHTIAGQGVVAIKELLENKNRSPFTYLEGHTSIQKKTLSRNETSKYRTQTIQDEISPYNDESTYKNAGRQNFSPIRQQEQYLIKKRARPQSSVGFSKQKKSDITALLQTEEQIDSAAAAPQLKRGNSTSGFNNNASINSIVEEVLRNRRNEHKQARNRNQSQTHDIRHLASETRLTPLTQIDEINYAPTQQKHRLTSAASQRAGTKLRNKQISADDRKDRSESRQNQHLINLFQPQTPIMTNTTGLMNSNLPDDMNKLKKDSIKAKVGYEWKTIYKYLSRVDTDQLGTVNKQEFKEACSQVGVGLSNDEVKRISLLFAPATQANSDSIDYIRMSRELNLHYNSLNFVSQKSGTVKNLKEIIQRSAQTDKKQLNFQELRNLMQGCQKKLDNNRQRPNQTEMQKRSGSRNSLHQQTIAQKQQKPQKVVIKSRALSLLQQQSQSSDTPMNGLGENQMTSDFKKIISAFGIDLSHQEIQNLMSKQKLRQQPAAKKQRNSSQHNVTKTQQYNTNDWADQMMAQPDKQPNLQLLINSDITQKIGKEKPYAAGGNRKIRINNNRRITNRSFTGGFSASFTPQQQMIQTTSQLGQHNECHVD